MKQRLYRSCIELTNHPLTSRLLKKFATSSVSKYAIKSYAKVYKINMEEVEGTTKQFSNLHSFFIRNLKQNVRVVDRNPHSIVSPVDGVLADYGKINIDHQIKIKDKLYSISEMLGNEKIAQKYAGGTFLLFYLSPAHYHRIHSPLSGKVSQQYSRGTNSFPVNLLGLKYGDAVLSKNYRLITELKSGEHTVAIVKVGAMFVNSIEIIKDGEDWSKGEEVAYFSFGSSVILLFEKQTFTLEDSISIPSEIKMGERIGLYNG